MNDQETVDEAALSCNAEEEAWVEEETAGPPATDRDADAVGPLATGEDRDPGRHLDRQPAADRDPLRLPSIDPADADENESNVGSHIQRNPKGHFLPGNKEWVAGQAERLIKAAEVRRQRLDRTRKLLATLSLEDCEHAATRLRELMDDEDGRVALAAVKLLMDTVTVKDTGESDPEGRGAGGPTFRFVIPMELPVARRRV